LALSVASIYFFDIDHTIPFIIILLSLAAEIVLKLNRFSTKKFHKRKAGVLRLTRDSIFIKKQLINISEIKELELTLNDYYGKVNYKGEFDYDGMYSEGVSNYIEVITKENETYDCHFRIYTKKHKLGLVEFMNSAVKLQLITLEEAKRILGLKKKDQETIKRLTENIL